MRKLLCSIVAVSALLLAASLAHAITLVKDGKPVATIFVSQGAVDAKPYGPSRGVKATPEQKAKLAAEPANHQARFDLAMAHYAAGRNDQAVDALVEIIRRDRKWNDEAARLQLLKLFEAFGPTNPATTTGRRKLSSVLFS